FGPTKASLALPEIVADLKRHKTIPVDLSVRVNGIMAISTIYQMMAMAKKEPDPKMHKEIFDLYKGFLTDPQVMMRIRAVEGIRYLGPISRDAIKEVITMSGDPVTWEVRKEA